MTYEWSGLDYEPALDLTMQRSPEAFPFGVYVWANVHHYFGGGTGSLHWFADQDECRAFVENVLVVDGSDGPTPEASAQAGAVLADDGLSPENLWILTDLKLQQLAFDWAGPLADLEQGDGVFPQKVRAHFREEGSTGAIAPDERDAFIVFLGEYGI